MVLGKVRSEQEISAREKNKKKVTFGEPSFSDFVPREQIQKKQEHGKEKEKEKETKKTITERQGKKETRKGITDEETKEERKRKFEESKAKYGKKRKREG